MSQRHIPALDGLRGIAILLVVVFHYWLGWTAGPLDQFVQFWAGAGWIGVDLFFVLSGFLITGILLASKGRAGYFRVFYARRVLRICPLYFIVLLFLLLIGTSRAPWPWLFLTNVQVAFEGRQLPPGVDVTWSLGVEEQFYLVWPAVVLLCSRRSLLLLCVTLAALAFIGRLLLLGMGVTPFVVYMLTPARMDSLAVGAAAAVLARGRTGPCALHARARRVAIVAGGVLLAVALANGRLMQHAWGVQVLGFSAAAVLFAAVLLTVLGAPDGRLSRALENRVLRVFGEKSYALYLLHMLVREALLHVFESNPPALVAGSVLPMELAFTGLGLVLSLGLAYLSWHLLEAPMLRLKARFVYGAPEVAEPRQRATVQPLVAA
jgi:peptidoglycan/LPS O-acetylase OafA/YrhL